METLFDGRASSGVAELRRVSYEKADQPDQWNERNRNINELEGEVVVETVPRRGYRLGGLVTDSWEEEDSSARLEPLAVPVKAEDSTPHRRRLRLPAAALLAVLAAALAVFLARRSPAPAALVITPLTNSAW